MKLKVNKKRALMFTCIFWLLNTHVAFSRTLIEGKVTNLKEEQIYFTNPISGLANIIIEDSVSLYHKNSVGSFRIHLNNETTVFIKIRIGGLPVWLLIEPNDYLNITIDAKKFETSIEGLNIKGKNSSCLLLFNKNNISPVVNYNEVDNLFNNSNLTKELIIKSTKEICLKKIYEYKKMLDDNKISLLFFNIISSNIKALLIGSVFNLIDQSKHLKETLTPYDLNFIRQELYSIQNPLDINLFQGINTELYIYDYYKYYLQKVSNWDSFDITKDSCVILDSTSKFSINKFFVPFLCIKEDKYQEFIMGKFLVHFLNLKIADSYRDAYELFYRLYPNSLYTQYLKNASGNSSVISSKELFLNSYEDVEILDTLGEITSLSDLKNLHTKGIIYVDLWASWCLPCIQEFIYSKENKLSLDSLKITSVYISIDNSKNNDTWRQTIYRYNLKGYHILAGNILKKEILKKVYNSKDIFTIPRYLILDKNGILLERNALSPSNKEKLLIQLKKISSKR